ncbi:hypothetical protein RIF29_34608 [Crotalaria pallida]|uniref:Uncharacterized protein n=1 Tax=Crotalaria pallida TaxID=3830 RepID=A0AAN9HUR7_CROPI
MMSYSLCKNFSRSILIIINMHTQQHVSNVVEGVSNHFKNSSNSYNNFSLGYCQTNDGNQLLTDVTQGRFVHSNPNPNNNNMFFDLYLSNLLNGAASSSSSSLCCDYGNQNLNTDLKPGNDVQDCSDGKREMDLIEMVCSQNFSNRSF